VALIDPSIGTLIPWVCPIPLVELSVTSSSDFIKDLCLPKLISWRTKQISQRCAWKVSICGAVKWCREHLPSYALWLI
jgi:hypothetical protein